MGVYVPQTTDDLVIRDDTDIDLFMPGEVGGKTGGDLGMPSEEHRQDVRINQ